jgi:hypothetical protein
MTTSDVTSSEEQPGEQPIRFDAMREVGFDLAGRIPKKEGS